MAKTSTQQFTGFPKDCLVFLSELAANNERAWFLANKSRYEQSVVAPMVALIADMAPRLAKTAPHYIADPRRSLFRIYRDVRFSRDKRPYKTHAAAQFRHEAGRDVHAPGFYVHIAPEEIFFGGGMWMPPPPALKAVRDTIARDPQGWRRAIGEKSFRAAYGTLSDEGALKRPPRGYDPAHPQIDDIKRTSFVFGCTARIGDIAKPAFLDQLDTGYRAAKPVMRFLCQAVGLPY